MSLKLSALCVAAITLMGCQINTVNLTPKFTSVKAGAATKKRSPSCFYNLNKFTDIRNSDSLGIVAQSIVKTDVNSLFLSALDFYDVRENVEAPVSINVYLVKAYVQSLMTSMSANVVVAIETKTSNQQDYHSKQYYRGYHVSVNWNSGEGEIMSLINHAIIDSLAKARTDLDAVCLTWNP